MDRWDILQAVQTAGWTTNATELEEIVELLDSDLQKGRLDYVYTMCDALLAHDLSGYSAYYRATFEISIAWSQPDDSWPDGRKRLRMAKRVIEKAGTSSDSRLQAVLDHIIDSLENEIMECPSPGHPDRRETKKVYSRPENWDDSDEASEDTEMDSDQESEDAEANDAKKSARSHAQVPASSSDHHTTLPFHTRDKASSEGDQATG